MTSFLKVAVVVCVAILTYELVLDFYYAFMQLLWELSNKWRIRRRNKTRNKEV